MMAVPLCHLRCAGAGIMAVTNDLSSGMSGGVPKGEYKMKKLIETLVNIPSACGHEQDIIRYLRDYLCDKVDEWQIDGIGNLIVKKSGAKPGPTLMVSSHSDEVGFMVKKIEESGLIRFEKNGGHDDRILPAEPVWVCTESGPLYGVIGFISAHMRRFDNAEKVRPYTELYIDIGARDKAGVEAMGVQVGDPIVWGSPYREIGQNRAVGHGFDDKVGCAILARLFEEVDFSQVHGTVYGVFSVQEEVGLRGARAATHVIDPDVALSVDTTAAGDTPEAMMDKTLCLGKGPGIKAMDGSLLASKAVRKFLQNVAKEHEIPYQVEILVGIGTDAGEMQNAGKGVPTCGISIPSRTAHSAVEVIDLDDAENAKELLKAFVLTMKEKDEFKFVK